MATSSTPGRNDERYARLGVDMQLCGRLLNTPPQPGEKHFMIDLETLGTTPGSAIVSLAAVWFDLFSGAELGYFRVRIRVQSCLDAGLTVSGSTLEWWMGQSDAVRAQIKEANSFKLEEALSILSDWMDDIDPDKRNRRIWGNGIGFDGGILAAAYAAIKRSVPWAFWGERDTRTIVDLIPEVKKAKPFQGTQHDPLDDARHQISYVSTIWLTVQRALATAKLT